MRVQRVLLLAIILLCLPVPSFAQSSRDTENAAIRQVIQSYFDGWLNDDVASMEKAFHPKAKWYYRSPKTGDMIEETMPKVYSGFHEIDRMHAPKRSAAGVRMKIVSLDIAGDAASARVEVFYPGANSYIGTEYLLLKKFSYGWKIVSKVASQSPVRADNGTATP